MQVQSTHAFHIPKHPINRSTSFLVVVIWCPLVCAMIHIEPWESMSIRLLCLFVYQCLSGHKKVWEYYFVCIKSQRPGQVARSIARSSLCFMIYGRSLVITSDLSSIVTWSECAFPMRKDDLRSWKAWGLVCRLIA